MSTETETGPDRPEAPAEVVQEPRAGAQPAAPAEDEFSARTHVYEPHRVGLPKLGPYVREIWRRREFAVELARTKVRSQHLNTAFGQLWLVLNPLMLAGVYFILVDILRTGPRPPGYFAHLVAGIFAYYFFSNAVREATRSVVSGGRLVLNTAFPRVMLPLSSVMTSFYRFLPTVVIYIPIHIVSDLPVTWNMLWVLPILFMLALVTAGVSMFVAALQVYFRDVKNFIPYVLRVWLYASPVLYYAYEVPERWRFVLDVNPIGALLTAWSAAINAGRTPAAGDLLVGLAWGTALFVIGAVFFMSRERDFAVRL